jgi:hypothetical protein
MVGLLVRAAFEVNRAGAGNMPALFATSRCDVAKSESGLEAAPQGFVDPQQNLSGALSLLRPRDH